MLHRLQSVGICFGRAWGTHLGELPIGEGSIHYESGPAPSLDVSYFDGIIGASKLKPSGQFLLWTTIDSSLNCCYIRDQCGGSRTVSRGFRSYIISFTTSGFRVEAPAFSERFPKRKRIRLTPLRISP
jgi:hypothetical protein